MGGGIQEHRERKGKEKGVGGNGLCSNLRRMPPARRLGALGGGGGAQSGMTLATESHVLEK